MGNIMSDWDAEHYEKQSSAEKSRVDEPPFFSVCRSERRQHPQEKRFQQIPETRQEKEFNVLHQSRQASERFEQTQASRRRPDVEILPRPQRMNAPAPQTPESRRHSTSPASPQLNSEQLALVMEQFAREDDAQSRGEFTKHQRVRYHDKIADRWVRATVVKVHHDDSEPAYYTITLVNETGNLYEKQTVYDRLRRRGWNEAETLKLLDGDTHP
jgi:hypothetical protein